MEKIDKILNSRNPAWEMYLFLEKHFGVDESHIFSQTEILDLYYKSMEGGVDPIECIRKNFVARHWCCAVPSPEILKLIATFSPLVEIGAGSGYWADQLHRLGANIEALDNGLDFKAKYFEVRHVPEIDLSLFSDRTLLLVWPSDGLDWAYELLEKVKWKNIIYIGEWKGGHMATAAFFDKIESDYSIKSVMQMPRYPTWEDSCFIFENKSL